MREPPLHFVPGIRWPETLPPETLVFAFRRRSLLIAGAAEHGSSAPRLEALGDLPESLRRQYLGRLGEHPVVSLELPEDHEPPEGMSFRGLRSLFPLLDGDQLSLAGLAIQMVDWDRDHQFCGRCGHPMESSSSERSKRCGQCSLVSYPRLSPAVIVLVERGDEILLARSSHFPPGMYSTLAGFVEPGESLERTVVREIEEEVGVEVGRLRYFGSQPWPFPNSLMVGFRADWLSGEIVTDDEIEDAGWYRAHALPHIPPRISIARSLIEAFLAEQRG